MRSIEEGREMLTRKNNELLQDLQLKEEKSTNQMYNLEKDINELKTENKSLHQKKKKYKLECEKLKEEKTLYEITIEKLENEVLTFKKQSIKIYLFFL